MKAVAMMLKAIHAQESKEAAREKARQVAEKLKEMKLSSAAKQLQDGIEENSNLHGLSNTALDQNSDQ